MEVELQFWVRRSVYWSYMRAWGPVWLPALVAGLAIGERAIAVGQNFWLAIWSDATADAEALGEVRAF